MKRQRIKEIRTLIVRLALIAGIAIASYLVYRLFFKAESKEEIILDETPLKVEQIRAILELNTLKFQDEAVVDSVEYYQSQDEFYSGTLDKLLDIDQLKNGLNPSGVKRRLTLIVRGELLYGVDLKRKDFQFIPKGDTLEILIPEPELLSISLNPKGTEVYLENGKWNDYERTHLQKKARNKMIVSGNRLKLPERAKAPLEKAIRGLVRTDKIVVISFSK
ncbi:DUF4230 domain-containing protein [Fluviicola taffensis]|uniref:Uncharacterized protein n=1 Tax=Fluviicola taffensis (strain DSM 16823 / NCIMB 13979 / RW262) TaxID=755732 RepID=F2IIW3_FLUTR|nr:DUF4230 domain-containing protein [Fluviicola taffensis]AEA42820.1 hypothetical protein Fluta_0817 [Fluviicola taffensis DSM 16823]